MCVLPPGIGLASQRRGVKVACLRIGWLRSSCELRARDNSLGQTKGLVSAALCGRYNVDFGLSPQCDFTASKRAILVKATRSNDRSGHE